MSPTIESSEVYQLNNNPEQKVKLSPETEIVLEKALYYAKLTGGKFDPTVGALVDLWGIGTENARVPDQIEIEAALDSIGYQYLTIDDNHQAEIKKAGVKIDLGGIAKGFAADQVKKIVEKHNVKSAFVNLGGNVLVIGSKADGSKWRIGIQDPRKDRGNVMAIIETTDQTIVTSGNYERYFIKDGKLYHHILDPATGYPAESHLLSASIVSNSSFDADALSTAVYIMGVKAGLKFIENLPGVEAMFITDELNVYLSSGLKNKVEITSQDFNLIEGGN
jgi:thiamine biosynthesis lipoprotein